jgi:hypothetical protein
MTESTALIATGSVFSGIQAFEEAQRIAKALASSTLIPPQFQGQQGFANCLVALEIANRMNISPFLAMQHLHVIHGRPTWSSSFIIAMVNGCGRFSPLQYELSGTGDDLACYAIAIDIASEQKLKGPTITMTMAKKEGWASKAGSKWLTMPEHMICLRAAAFWARLYASDLFLGMQAQEEAIDVQPVVVKAASTSIDDLNAQINPPVTAENDDHDEIF